MTIFLRWIKTACVVLFFPMLLNAAEPSRQALPVFIPELKQIIDRGKLIVATNKAENPLFQMKDEKGEYVGQDMEMAKMLGEALGVPVEIIRTASSNDEVIEQIAKGEADIGISKLSYTTERAKKVLFTMPYLLPNKALVVNRARLEKLGKQALLREALNDPLVSIGVVKKSSYVDYAKHFFPRAEVKSYDWSTILPDLISGKTVAGFGDEIRVKVLLKKNPEAALNVLPIIIKGQDDPLVMAVRKDAPLFLLWVNTLLDRGDYKIPEVNELIDRYLKILEIKKN